MNEIAEQIKQNAVEIAKLIMRGSSAEIHPSKDGIKIYEIKKKAIPSNK